MTNCKNCKYTDEYCASGDCTLGDNNLTEQWRKGELPEGYYYVKDGENMIAEYLDGYFYNNGEPMTSFTGGVDSVLAPVPSYEKYISLVNWKEDLTKLYTAKERIIEKYENIDTWWKAEYTKLKEENDKLKEVIHIIKHQCEFLMPKNGLNPIGDRAVMKMFLTKIDEVLNA